jgi:hypothetical protein
MRVNTSEDFSGGTFLDEPGTYHILITNVADGEGPKGGAIDGFTFEGQVLAGTVEGQEGKTISETVFLPGMDESEDSQARANRKVTAFLLASNLVTPAELGKEIDVDIDSAEDQQIIVDLERQMAKDEETGKWDVETKFLRIAYSNIYHVDDPRAAKVPKYAEALEEIDASNRHTDAGWFDFVKKKGKAASKASNGKKPAKQNRADDIASSF